MIFKLLESFISDNESEDKYEFCPARGLVLCFRPRLRAHVIVFFLNWKQLTSLAFFTSASLRVFKEKHLCYGSKTVAYG